MNAILNATEIVKTFGQEGNTTVVLNSVSIKIRQGEFVAVMGPSGSGKSTLLYCVSGMDVFDQGSVQLGDTTIESLSEDERTVLRGERMGFVFQDPNLLESLNVLDNIMLAALLQDNAEPEQLQTRAMELMKATGIEGLEARGVSELSGGQRQRVSLCRALLHTPDMLFGDEPTGALNSRASAEIIDLLHTFNADGMTMLIVTHDARVAAHSTRVLFLADGMIRDELYLERSLPLETREQTVMETMAELGI